jgi:hypothetical protein
VKQKRRGNPRDIGDELDFLLSGDSGHRTNPAQTRGGQGAD